MYRVFQLLFLFFAVIHLGASSDFTPIQMPERGICAHRGAMNTHPENTLPAFREAIRLGVQMIEFDVQASKDGHLVVMHDSTVDRTTDGNGEVSELTLSELRKLDAGIKKGEQFKGTRIPTLRETLQIMPENIWLNIHLKDGEKIVASVAKMILKEKRQRQSFLACSIMAAQSAREISPGIQICNMDRQRNTMDYANETIHHKAQFIQLLGDGAVFSEVISKLRKHKIRINYYRADTPEICCELLSAGIDFPLVNDPGAMMTKIQTELGIKPLVPIYR
ncbi:MAG: glycerophosphodiester phosphodiesterase family protein [Candidatus Hinthialibacter antarcticus]|nr:glycerophosphodiester phosphodiesterase family protein [Candidatus Hinthialibacter antarcticus]